MRHSYIDRPRRIRAPRATARSRGRFLPAVVPFSLAIAVGGAVWCWLYERTGSLLGPWLSHLIIDAAIFVVAWDLLQR